MKLLGQHGVLLHPRRAARRKEYITSSLTSSSELSSRLFNSLNGDPSRALAMKFHEEWLHPDCPVQKWYQEQQGVRSSTKFTRIEHWRTDQAPFFHEYLLIRLGDQGRDICRIERMGDGSGGSRGAISRKGCAAYDIIQWLPTSDPASNLSDKMICRVDLPRPFDLIDVLAICWSIQKTRRCSVYTLQRYNCYFLCLTILTVLSRRVGAWETVIESEDAWSTIVGDVIEYLEQTQCESADEYIALETPKLLDPDHPSPRKFVLDSLRSHFTADGLNVWSAASTATLWAKDIESAIQENLGDVIKAAAEESLDGEDTCATQMKYLFDNQTDDVTHETLTEHNIPHEFAQVMVRSLLEGFAPAMLGAIKSQNLMHRKRGIERQPALWSHALSWAGAPLAYVCILLFALILSEQDKIPVKKSTILRGATGNLLDCLSICRLGLLDYCHKVNHNDDGLTDTMDDEMVFRMGLTFQKILQSPTCPSRDTKFQVMQMLYWKSVWILNLQSCLSRVIAMATNARIVAIESSSNRYLLRMAHIDGEVQELPPMQFHEIYIQDRIRKHADHVGSMGLAAAPLMEIDIHAVMGDVWRGLPIGYGGLFSSVNE